jgi:Fe-S cluster biogenesis protein NfuA
LLTGVYLFLLQGACGSCPSALTTMTMGIKRRLMEKIPVRHDSRHTAVCSRSRVLHGIYLMCCRH